MSDIIKLIDTLSTRHKLTSDEYLAIINNTDEKSKQYLFEKAKKQKEAIFGNGIFIRGLIEISNICKNNCYYCGIRKDNKNCQRYRLGRDDILECCKEGYDLGFRTFVLQGGEDGYYTDRILADIISSIKNNHPDCAITLSLGEKSKESYRLLKDAGADRYLLRHETATKEHYNMLHPKTMSFEKRMECLYNLCEIGFQVGCGFMVGSPYQTNEMIVKDIEFIGEFKPEMCGIGPFIPHKDTKFNKFAAGSVQLTCILLSIIRLLHPTVLLPATTALGTLDEFGREKGIMAGANVVMPNLSPSSVRNKYMLYDNKLSDGAESAEAKCELEKRLTSIGCEITMGRGDAPDFKI